MNSTAKKISSYNELELKGYLLSMIARTNDRSKLLRFVEVGIEIIGEEKDETTKKSI